MRILIMLLCLLLIGCPEEPTQGCPEPTLIGLSTPPTDFENEVIRGAKIKCGFLYDGACLKKLEQVRPRGFKATCRRQQ